MISLKNSRILFLSVSFFQYEKSITQKLIDLGAEVDFYDERPYNSNFSKGIIRFNKKLYQLQIHLYYQRILKEIQHKKYNYFLLIKGEAVPEFFLKKIKELNPEVQTIYYNFDSLEEYPKLVPLLKYFDKKFTFDRKDAHDYGLHFRPLFYLDEYKNAKTDQDSQNLDICFIGSAHTDRYLIGEKIKKIADESMLRTYFYYYAMGRFVFLLKKIFDKKLKYFNPKKISFKKLSHHQIIDFYKRSKAILDINKPFQNGLTIRTFEALAMGKKLITTNLDVINYPFYTPQNIYAVDRNNIDIELGFFQSEFKELDEKTLYMMSLDSWVECLFIKDQDQYWKK